MVLYFSNERRDEYLLPSGLAKYLARPAIKQTKQELGIVRRVDRVACHGCPERVLQPARSGWISENRFRRRQWRGFGGSLQWLQCFALANHAMPLPWRVADQFAPLPKAHGTMENGMD